jgi:HD superfamily phosphodiesterase
MVLNKSTDPQHSFNHVDRVRKNALKIIKLLKIKNLDSNLVQATCVLHDVPMSKFQHNPAIKHFFENYAVNKFLPGILNDLQIKGVERQIITNAIRRHTLSIPYGRLNKEADNYSKILQDADSIDFFSMEREASFMENRGKYLSYLLISPFVKKFLDYGRNNLGKYLNYPQLSKYNWYKSI